MHVVAMTPRVVDASELDSKLWMMELAHYEKEISAADNPAAFLETLREQFERRYCLLPQPYVKEQSVTVGQHIAAVSSALHARIAIVRFAVFAAS